MYVCVCTCVRVDVCASCVSVCLCFLHACFGSSMFLMGPVKQLKRMFEEKRFIATIVMLVRPYSVCFYLCSFSIIFEISMAH